jgi:RNA polymerase sigma-70 factor (ECF subfamily)
MSQTNDSSIGSENEQRSNDIIAESPLGVASSSSAATEDRLQENEPASREGQSVCVATSQFPDGNDQTLERFRSYLYLLARTHLEPGGHHKIEASDLVQQTLLDAHRNRSQFRGDCNAQLAAWLKKILACNLADALRHHGRAKRDVSRKRSLEDAINDSFGHADSWLAATQSTPSERLAKKEQLVQLADAITQLPAAQQDAIVLHHLQGLSLAEVAAHIGRSEAAVAGLLYRGLKQLNILLDEPD